MTTKTAIRISIFLLSLAWVGGSWAQVVLRGTGGRDQAAEAIIRRQAPTKWFSTHKIGGVVNGSDATSLSPIIGSGTLAVGANKPKVYFTNDTSEPGNTRTSPTGKTPLYFYDGGDRRMTLSTSIASTNQTVEFVLSKDWATGDVNLWSLHNSLGTNKDIFFGSSLNQQKYRPQIAYNGGTGAFQKNNDIRPIGVLTLKWSTASAVTVKWNNQDSSTVDLSAAFASGNLDVLTIGGTVYGGGGQGKFWSYMEFPRATTDDEDAERFSKVYQGIFDIPYTVDVMAAASTLQANVILKPPGGSANPAINRVFLFNHGAGQDAEQVCLRTPTYEAVMRHFVKAGWYVACTTAGGTLGANHWGNQGAIDDLGNLYAYIKTNYTSSGKLVIGAHSMGNLLTLNALRLGTSALITDTDGLIHAGNGLFDLDKFYDGEPPSFPQNPAFNAGICTAYGLTCPSCSTSSSTTCTDWVAKTGNYDPADQLATSWSAYRVYVAMTTADTLVKQASHPSGFITLVTGNVVSLSSITGNCDHGDSNCPGSPIRMYVPAQWLAMAQTMTD